MSNDKGQENYEAVLTALRENAEKVFANVADSICYLGSKDEWSMDDNFSTTEGIASLATSVGLPTAGDQTAEALVFYGRAAQHLGYDVELDEDEEDES